jgi:lipid-A-disaccharide synthase
MPKASEILIVAGDPSGDQHGAELVSALRKQIPGLRISAMGGVHLRAVSDKFLYPLVELGGFGFLEPLFRLPRFWKAKNIVRDFLVTHHPVVVIPIDFYGFNIHVSRLAHAMKIPVCYFVSPQVWASRPSRIQKLAKVIDEMLVLFPFEEQLYRDAGVKVRWIGHPLIDRVPAVSEPRSPDAVGLLPGSRWGTIQRHLPILIEAAEEMRRRRPQTIFTVFRPEGIPAERYAALIGDRSWLNLKIDKSYADRGRLSVVISVSGTAALENMLLGIPMVIMYRLSSITYAIARRIIRVPYIGIPNLLAKRPIVPELIQDDATPQRLADAALRFLDQPDVARQTRSELLELRAQLGPTGAVERAAEAIASRVAAAS